MAQREFTITELKRAGDGGFVDTPVKFVWTNDKRSAPRGSWKFGVQQRSVREDYPGVEQPVEQILGPNYKEFNLSGVWDDRYNYGGFALETMRAFEKLVQRGSICRLEFETVSINGLIKDINFDYQRAARIGYEFTVSPHFRSAAGLATGNAGGRKSSEAFKPVNEYRDVVNAIADAANLTQAQAPAIKMSGTSFPAVKARLTELQAATASLQDTVDQRITAPGLTTFESLRRAANALVVIKGTAAGLMTDIAAFKSTNETAFNTAVDILDFDTWRCSLGAYARKLFITGDKGSRELGRRAEPKAIALYRPQLGESLYSISQRFYGTPTQWQLIATRNGLTTMTLQGTELLIIPERK